MILDKIIESTKVRLENKKNNFSLEDLISEVNDKLTFNDFNTNSFEESLKTNEISFICEVKKASPSKGVICNDFNPIKIAKDYENAGASAISVLTETEFFKGNDSYLTEIAKETNLPVLRKDFIIDAYMIYEAKLLGASAVLLITSILDKEDLENFIKLAYKLNLTPLVEVHSKKELKIAINAGANVIGVNNRNLKDFTVNINNTLSLEKNIPKNIRKNIIFISESGIKTPEDIKLLNDNNIDAVLIGETLMRNDDKKLAISNLKSLI